jgi:hypothetical protein
LDLFRNAIEVLHSRELALALRSTAHDAMGGRQWRQWRQQSRRRRRVGKLKAVWWC